MLKTAIMAIFDQFAAFETIRTLRRPMRQ